MYEISQDIGRDKKDMDPFIEKLKVQWIEDETGLREVSESQW